MKKIFSAVIFLGLLFLLVYPVNAQDERPKGLDEKGPLTKITFIHYKKGLAKPSSPGSAKKTNPICYSYLANGAKWKTTEDYVINPVNSGLENGFVQSAIDSGVAEWEEYGSSAIFGSGEIDPTATYNPDIIDYKNVAAFGSYPNSGVIAVTNVWGYFYGPPRTRELVEWDMLFNTDGDWTWGDATVDTADTAFMDLPNIATHELGHSAGMGDLYTTSCNLETMYGYSSTGEIIKRTLNSGDIAGISQLY